MSFKKHFNQSATDWKFTHGRSPSSTPHSLVAGKGVASEVGDWVQPLVIGVLGLACVVLAVVVAKQNPEAARRIGAHFVRLFGRLASMLGRHPQDEQDEQYEMPQLPAASETQRSLANRTDSERRRCISAV